MEVLVDKARSLISFGIAFEDLFSKVYDTFGKGRKKVRNRRDGFFHNLLNDFNALFSGASKCMERLCH